MSISAYSDGQALNSLMTSNWADEVEEMESLTSPKLTSPTQDKKTAVEPKKDTHSSILNGSKKASSSHLNQNKTKPWTILHREKGPNNSFKGDSQLKPKKSCHNVPLQKKQSSASIPIGENSTGTPILNNSRSFRNKTNNNFSSLPDSEKSKETSFLNHKGSATSLGKSLESSGFPTSRRFYPETDSHHATKEPELRSRPKVNDFSTKHRGIQEERNFRQAKGPDTALWNAAESALQNIGNAIKQNTTNTSNFPQKLSPDAETRLSTKGSSTFQKKGLGYLSTPCLEWVNYPSGASLADVLTLYGDFTGTKAASVKFSSDTTLQLTFISPDDAELAIRRHTLYARSGNLRRISQDAQSPTSPEVLHL